MNIVFVDPAALRHEEASVPAWTALGKLALAATADLVLLSIKSDSDFARVRPHLTEMLRQYGLDPAIRLIDHIGPAGDRSAQIETWLKANPACSHWATIGTSQTFENGEWPRDRFAILADGPEDFATLVDDHLDLILIRQAVTEAGGGI